MVVSSNRGTPKSSILVGFSLINHPFWGTPILGNLHYFLHLPIAFARYFALLIDIYIYIEIYIPWNISIGKDLRPNSLVCFNINKGHVGPQQVWMATE